MFFLLDRELFFHINELIQFRLMQTMHPTIKYHAILKTYLSVVQPL